MYRVLAPLNTQLTMALGNADEHNSVVCDLRTYRRGYHVKYAATHNELQPKLTVV